ncbi:hypothetical protein B1207_14060 [Legionella quinlivanii]|uniref:tRNA uridine(34) hydroxylase n=1 Tax=Legionella quinlivanii TaxID=45073 RepID=A0A364LG24_9GAMM|nr:rhodanese-related sulfurtransferase [Legionella quinlivanii]RAP35019.1 hypothetical protein B1207_14060 [Legionella quinlivanii]
MKSYLVAAFYKFVSIPNHETLREPLLDKMVEHGIKGTIILAHEGINGTFAGLENDVEAFIEHLRSYSGFADLHFKKSYDETNPFDKSKVKLRKEIVSFGIDDIDAATQAGIYVKPEEWNQLIQDPEVLTIDTRNDYEVSLGSFKGAINPKTLNFRDFPEYVQNNLMQDKHKKIAMFCTGGIRCEKSTAYLKKLGFEQVYHLEGGILNYLETIQENSLWEGSCFVFDNRVAVNAELEPLEEGTVDLEWKNKCRQQALEGEE